MGVFNFIETFFFISLGIAILLIALLVYHFKQRILSLEQKYETLFDIVTNMVKQMRNMHLNNQLAFVQQPATSHLGNFSNYNDIQYSHDTPTIDNESIHLEKNIDNTLNDISRHNSDKKLTNIYDYESENHSDSENEEDGDADSENESQDDSDSENEDVELSLNDTSNLFEYIIKNESNTNETVIVSDDELLCENENETIKYVSIPPLDTIDILIENTEIPENTEELQSNEYMIDSMIEPISNEPPVIVKKIEASIESNNIPIASISNNRDFYKKMNLNTLKTTVIEKGLCTDPSKMKKNELLKLLEEE
jgi:hypothetical protein